MVPDHLRRNHAVVLVVLESIDDAPNVLVAAILSKRLDEGHVLEVVEETPHLLRSLVGLVCLDVAD